MSIKFKNALLVTVLLILYGCVNPPPTDTDKPDIDQNGHPIVPLNPSENYVIYNGKLSRGFDMGVDTSERLTDWVSNRDGRVIMSYPGNQDWGAVFITVGKPADIPKRKSRDFSGFSKLSVQLRGKEGGEVTYIGLKDNTDEDDGSETKIRIANLTKEWKDYKFNLSEFRTADLTRLYVVTEFVFEKDTPQETIYFKNIKFLP